MGKRKIESVKQLPLMPLTVEDMTWNKTGTWRLLTPTMEEKSAPCRTACPIGQPIPGFIHAVSKRDWSGALELLLEFNPLPGVTGRLCYHPCQAQCVRKEFDRSVSVKELEKLVSDYATTPNVVRRPPTGRKLAVCGAGPTGLTAAYHLALQGCQVTLLDPSDRPGGILKTAIPVKLPAEILEREIKRSAALSGVLLRMNVTGLNFQEFDLIVVDRTSYQLGSEEALALEALATGAGPRLNIAPQKGGVSLRPIQVAHAVALGRRIASEALLLLNVNTVEINESSERVATKADIKFHLLQNNLFTDVFAPAEGAAGEEAIREAKRCLSCGTCNLCQSCVLACPDACCRVDEGQAKIVIDLYHCKGCGICVYECPRSVLVMEGD